METIRFNIGYQTTYSGLYGGHYMVEVIERTENTVTLRSFWIAEDTAEECHSEKTYNIEVDTLVDDEIEIERIVIWEYINEEYQIHNCGYLYAVSEDVLDYVYEHGRLPSDDEDISEALYVDPYEDSFRSAYCGDYSPSAPWNAPGMSASDFI